MSIDSILHLYKDTYYALPQSVKTFIGTLYGNIPLGVRFGNKYDIHKKIVDRYENGTAQFKLDFLYNKTFETLKFAEDHIPYYQTRFNQYAISSKDFKALEDIKLFPNLTKNDIKNNLDDIHINTFEKSTPYYTGGSTSAPTKYYLPLYTSRAKEKAYNNYIFSKIGYKYRDKTVLLKGREVADEVNRIFWEREPVDNYLIVSSNYITSDYFIDIYNKINKFKPKYFFAYPSAIIDFIKMAVKSNLPAFNIGGVILASEMVFEDELELIKNFFQCDVIIHYGHTERAVIAYKKNNEDYQFLNSYGLSRVVNGEILATGFDNLVMPFINYQTNDYVLGAPLFLGGTDIAETVENIEGRLQEYLVTKDKRLISICVMGAGHYSSLSNVDAIQYHQNKMGTVTLLVKSSQVINNTLIKEQLESFVKNAITFDIKQVESIPKSSRGKRIMCQQSLDIGSLRDL